MSICISIYIYTYMYICAFEVASFQGSQVPKPLLGGCKTPMSLPSTWNVARPQGFSFPKVPRVERYDANHKLQGFTLIGFRVIGSGFASQASV